MIDKQLLEMTARFATAMMPAMQAQQATIGRMAMAFQRMLVRVEGDHVVVLARTGRYLRVPVTARDSLGQRVALVRVADPTPLYTRHMLGEHEAARDTRRQRARARVVCRSEP